MGREVFEGDKAMTVHSIETVQELIEEIQGSGGAVDSVWEYTNGMNGKKMFAVFMAFQVCDIHQSPYVQSPELIWAEGKFGSKYAHLNG